MKILITGGTGFIGKTLIPYLYFNGMTNIALLVRNQDKANDLFGDLKLAIIDTNLDWRNEVISFEPDLVLHLATLFSGKSDKESAQQLINTNVLLTTLLVEALSYTKCRYFVNIGTFTEYYYGDGTFVANNLYSATKTAVRPIIQFYQTRSKWNWINVIIYSPYGRKNENKKVIDYMIEAMQSNTPIDFTKGQQILDFIHVDDIAAFFSTLIDKVEVFKEPFTELHLGTGVGHSIKEVADILERVYDKKINAIWGGRPYNRFDTMFAVAPIARNIELLDWRGKISLEEGLLILKNEN